MNSECREAFEKWWAQCGHHAHYKGTALAAWTAARAGDAVGDTKRFDWWFGDTNKDVNGYLRGVREHWTLDQWRAWIDAALSNAEGRPPPTEGER